MPASGFYEWQADGQNRQPFHLRRGRRPFAFAGLWEAGPRPRAGACLILTTEPNELVVPLHDRMPVILAPADQAIWLTRRARPGASAPSSPLAAA